MAPITLKVFRTESHPFYRVSLGSQFFPLCLLPRNQKMHRTAHEKNDKMQRKNVGLQHKGFQVFICFIYCERLMVSPQGGGGGLQRYFKAKCGAL